MNTNQSENQTNELKKKELKMREWEFFNDLVTARDNHLWRLGSLFVPTSFLIFSSAIIYRNNILNANGSYGLIFLLFLASITCYFFWGFFYLRTWVLDQISIEKMKDIENGRFEIHSFLEVHMEHLQVPKRPLDRFSILPGILVASWIGYFVILLLSNCNSCGLVLLTLIVFVIGYLIFFRFYSDLSRSKIRIDNYEQHCQLRRRTNRSQSGYHALIGDSRRR